MRACAHTVIEKELGLPPPDEVYPLKDMDLSGVWERVRKRIADGTI